MKKIERHNSGYLVLSKGISRIGDIMFDFANNSFLAGINSKSLLLVGIYQSLESIVGVIFNLFGGVIADNYKRKRIIITADFISGIVCIALSFISIQFFLIYAVIIANVILALMTAFSGPAYKAFTKEIVEEDNISKINSYLEASSTLIKVIIPVVAVLLYRIIGIRGILFLDGITFLISCLLIFLVSPIIEEKIKHEKISVSIIFQEFVKGIEYLLNHKHILMLIILSSLINFFLSAYNLLLPYSNQMFQGVSENIYGLFLGAEAIGGVLGASVSSFINKELLGSKLVMYLGISGLSLLFMPISYVMFSNTYILIMFPALFNLFLTVFNIQLFSFIQKNVDNDFLGRIFGIIFTVAIMFMPLGTVFFTVLLDPQNLFNFSIIGLFIFILSLLFLKFLNKKH